MFLFDTHRLTLGLCLTAVLILLSPISRSQNIKLDWERGMYLGQGLDYYSLERKGNCVTFEHADSLEESRYDTEFQKLTLSSETQVADLLNIDATLTYQNALFNAQSKISVTNQSTMNQYFANMSVYRLVLDKDITLFGVKLTPDAVELANNDLDAFHNRCGHGYLATSILGGELYVHFAMATLDQEQQSKIEGMLSGNGFGADGTVNVNKQTAAYIKNRELKIRGWQTGGARLILPNNPTEINAFYRNFAEYVRPNNLAEISAQYTSYETLPNWPGYANPDGPQVPYRLGNYRWQYNQLLAETSFILENPDYFINVNEASIRKMQEEISAVTIEIDNAARSCFSVPAGEACRIDPEWPDPISYHLPRRYRNHKCPTYSRDIDIHFADQMPLEHKSGDKDSKGHKPTAELFLALNPQQTAVEGYVSITESVPDHTTHRNNLKQEIFLESYDGCVSTITGPTSGSIVFDKGDNPRGWIRNEDVDVSGKGLVRGMECMLDVHGDDTGKVGCRNLRINSIRVRVDHEEDVTNARGIILRPDVQSARAIRGNLMPGGVIDEETGDIFFDVEKYFTDLADAGIVSFIATTPEAISRNHSFRVDRLNSMRRLKQIEWNKMSSSKKSEYVLTPLTQKILQKQGVQLPSKMLPIKWNRRN